MKIRKYQIVMLTGFLLIVFGQLIGLAILPIQEYEFYPEDGVIYNELGYIQAITPLSTELIATSVTAIPAAPPVYVERCDLTLVEETEFSRTWRIEVNLSLSDGDYRCWFWDMTNGKQSYTDFTIQSTPTLGGSFYINGILVTNPEQVIMLDTLTLNLRFTPTEGTPMQVSASWQGPASGTVDFSQSGTDWVANVELPVSGLYTLTLTATDGVSTITMSIFDLSTVTDGNGADGDGGVQVEVPLLSMGGFALIGVGAVMYVKERRKR